MKSLLKESVILRLARNPLKISLFLFVVTWWCAACSEDTIGQYPIDSTPPQPVSNPKVTNFAGGATITYDLPDETDLLYVYARYTLPNGLLQDIKTSVFSNSLTVKGFAKSQKFNLQLIAVDQSQNESTPVEVEIEPEDAIIYDVIRSINYERAFGGFKVTWENAVRDEITVNFLRFDEATDKFVPIEVFYSSEKKASRAVRGQEAVMSTFAVYARDMYYNYSDTLTFELEPLYEKLLDKNNFKDMPKLPAFPLHAWSYPNLTVLWDDVLIGNTSQTVYYIMPTDGIDAYFTMDMGVTANLSRFRMWGRADYFFRLHNPYDFYLMGTNDVAVANNAASADAQWIHLIDCISYRPSGLDSSVEATPDDYAFAAAGEEFEFDDAPAVRYIRFKVRKTWGGSNGLHLAEIRFWGAPIE